MQYKTIILELLETRPVYHSQLVSSKQLLSTMDQLATELKSLHREQLILFSRQHPNRSLDAVTSEALEVALSLISETLPPEK